MAEPRLWTKDFTVAIIAAVFLSFVFYLLITTMAGYAVIRFAASDSAAGLASSSFVLGAVAARMFCSTSCTKLILQLWGPHILNLRIKRNLTVVSEWSYWVSISRNGSRKIYTHVQRLTRNTPARGWNGSCIRNYYT